MPARLKMSIPIDVASFLMDAEMGLTPDGKRLIDRMAEDAARRLEPPSGQNGRRRWEGWRWETIDRIVNLHKAERYRRAGDRHTIPFLIIGELVRDDA